MVQGRVLVIAGSDSSGGAGLEADQKVIAAHGCYAMTATTALTAQDTRGVYAVHHVPREFLRQQIDACVNDIGVDVVKMGMLASAGTIEEVADALMAHSLRNVVVDPVMVSTSGAELLPKEAVSVLRTVILPLTRVLTPNIPEAKLLLSDAGVEVPEINSVANMETIARLVQSLGPEWVLVKGGHVPFKADLTVAKDHEEMEVVVDVLCGDDGVYPIRSVYQTSRNTHGTGCSLASAIASKLAKGLDVPGAVISAIRYVEAGIRTAPGLGHGHGPLNHFHSNYSLPFAPGRFLEYLCSRDDVVPHWQAYINHAFVRGLGDGTLPLSSFKGYLVQDYLYLVHFARANALASYKAKDMKDIAASAAIVTHIAHEMRLHQDYCRGFGISPEEMEGTTEHQACTAYTRYILDIGHSEDWIGLQMAIAPCLLGYGAIAEQLNADPNSKREGNRYWPWIENYLAEDYLIAVDTGTELLERHAVLQSPSRIEDLVKIFVNATKMETAFWEMFPVA